ncbi:hypothetical protein [Alteribacillus bidgolensis]|uniref:Uncharacterized protein n=1 Tax=Alteribacillus bidgolensis TaxID=930129 RepID=A0A1G8Q588_9BACI|nr:hypothetical protein [Alteribacillus bidgolensis]SDI99924.1 hypothetical protein SAMN05216352_1185 [Alteribacillus bidgolensis]
MAGNAKERKQKKEIAQKMMETKGMKYNDWLHEKHQEYIDDNLIDYMNMQEEKQEEKNDVQSNEPTSSTKPKFQEIR